MIENKKCDDRIIQETGKDAYFSKKILSFLAETEFQLVCVSYKKDSILQVIAQRKDQKMTIQDCVQLNRLLSSSCVEEEMFHEIAGFEVSSPGIDRCLVRIEDFMLAKKCLVKMKTKKTFFEKKNFEAYIVEVDDRGVSLVKDLSLNEPIFCLYTEMIEAKLVLTDSLLFGNTKKDLIKEDRKK